MCIRYSCTDDRHCGPNCKTCGVDYVIESDGSISSKPPTDKPFCYTPDNRTESAVCVRCRADKDCGEGGTCDPMTHQCNTACATPCASNQVCDGKKCVECFTSAQCPCGICVDGSCTPNCESSSDCLGTVSYTHLHLPPPVLAHRLAAEPGAELTPLPMPRPMSQTDLAIVRDGDVLRK